MLERLLFFVHVASNLVWIGSILAVGLLAGSKIGSPKERGALALRVYVGLAVPGFLLAFAAGLGRLLLSPAYYFTATQFMHPKLTLAVIVIALHHVLGAKAKKMARGELETFGAARALTAGLFVAALGAAFFAVYKPF